ncbi:hypothetical protein CM15mP35_02960 [bacterium]|nr:MAG: hypothetical protein CM15mP35_02960 [bacterium]
MYMLLLLMKPVTHHRVRHLLFHSLILIASANSSGTGFLLTYGGSGIETDIAELPVDSSDNIYITGNFPRYKCLWS